LILYRRSMAAEFEVAQPGKLRPIHFAG
jgi:hypothetical protein